MNWYSLKKMRFMRGVGVFAFVALIPVACWNIWTHHRFMFAVNMVSMAFALWAVLMLTSSIRREKGN